MWAAVNHHMSRAMIGGRLVVPRANAAPPFWRFNWIERQLYFSAFHISPTNVPHYVEALNKFKPDYLVGYAFSHYSLARMILNQNLKVHSPKAVLTSSEKLTPDMEEVIRKVYQCPIFDAYSGVEACCLVSECEHHRFHTSPDVGIVEIIGKDGKSVSVGMPGEIVATGLLNFVQPLIRYRTGDYAAFSEERCPCGRQMPVIKELIGRLEDILTTKDGREIVIVNNIFKGIDHIRQGQIIQEDLERICLRLVVDSEFGEATKKVIEKRFEERLGKIKLSYEIVKEIPKTENGKFRSVISKIPRFV